MKIDLYEANAEPARADGLNSILEQECEAWDWVRAAGVSAQELRAILREWLSLPKAA